MAQFAEPAGEKQGTGWGSNCGPAGQLAGRVTWGGLSADMGRGVPKKIKTLPLLRIP